MDLTALSDKKKVNISEFRAAAYGIPTKTEDLEWMLCSGGCGRQVIKPAFFKNIKKSGGGKININCPHCSKTSKFEADLKKKEAAPTASPAPTAAAPVAAPTGRHPPDISTPAVHTHLHRLGRKVDASDHGCRCSRRTNNEQVAD